MKAVQHKGSGPIREMRLGDHPVTAAPESLAGQGFRTMQRIHHPQERSSR